MSVHSFKFLHIFSGAHLSLCCPSLALRASSKFRRVVLVGRRVGITKLSVGELQNILGEINILKFFLRTVSS